jgi:hypothetical protein
MLALYSSNRSTDGGRKKFRSEERAARQSEQLPETVFNESSRICFELHVYLLSIPIDRTNSATANSGNVCRLRLQDSSPTPYHHTLIIHARSHAQRYIPQVLAKIRSLVPDPHILSTCSRRGRNLLRYKYQIMLHTAISRTNHA